MTVQLSRSLCIFYQVVWLKQFEEFDCLRTSLPPSEKLALGSREYKVIIEADQELVVNLCSLPRQIHVYLNSIHSLVNFMCIDQLFHYGLFSVMVL